MAGTPFKLCLDSVSTPDKKVKIGIVAKSFDHLKAVAQEKLGLSDNVSVFLEDGTLICEEEYFNMLEPQTKLTIRDNWQNVPFLGQKRPGVSLESDYTAKRNNSVHAESLNLMTTLSQVQQLPQPAHTLQYLQGYQHALTIYQQPYGFIPANTTQQQYQANVNCIPRPEWQYQNLHRAVQNPAAYTVNHSKFNPSVKCQRSPPLLLKVPSAITNSSNHMQSAAALSTPSRSQANLQTILTTPPTLQPLSPTAHRQLPNFISPTQPPSSRSCARTVRPHGQVGTVSRQLAHPPINVQRKIPSILPASVDHEREAIIEKTIQYLKHNAPSCTPQSGMPHLHLMSRESDIHKPTENPKDKVPSSLPLIQTKQQDLSFDDGYASCSATTSPSPSVTEAPTSVSTLMEQSLLEIDVILSKAEGGATTDYMPDKDSDQTIPHVRKDVSCVDSVTDGCRDTECTQDKVKEEVESDDLFIVNIPIHVENGHIVTKRRTNNVEVIVIDSDSEVEIIDEKNETITQFTNDTKSPNLEEASEAGNQKNKLLHPEVHPPKKEKPVEVAEYGSEEVVCTSKERCTIGDVNEALSSLLKISVGDLNPIQTRLEIEELFMKACDFANQSVIVDESVLLDSSNFKEENESEHIVFNPEDITDVLGLEEEINIVLQSDVANEVTISEEPTAQNDSQALVSLLTEPEGQVETEVLEVECNFDVTSVTLTSKYGYSPSDISEHMNESPIAEKIDSLLEIADLLSAEDSATVKAFLSGTPTDPRHKVKTFPVTRMPDGRSLFLQLNFSSGEWEGRLTK